MCYAFLGTPERSWLHGFCDCSKLLYGDRSSPIRHCRYRVQALCPVGQQKIETSRSNLWVLSISPSTSLLVVGQRLYSTV